MKTDKEQPLQPAKSKGGRPKGQVNRSTSNARKAIAGFVDTAAPHLLEWLASVANGIPATDEKGQVLRDGQGAVRWVNKPDPNAAIKATSDLLEYHIPRLTRTEATVVQRFDGPFDPSTMSTDDLKRYVMEQLGHTDQAGTTIIDVVPEREPTFAERQEGRPDWLK